MIRRDYLVVGGGIGGASACEGIRKYDKRGSVTLVGAEPFAPYKRWIISKSFLREKESNLKKLQEFDERWFDANKIEARFGTVVTQFNIERRLAVPGQWRKHRIYEGMSGDGQPARTPCHGRNKSWQRDLFANDP